MTNKVEFFCEGIPVAQGSKRHIGKGVLIESNDKTLRPWRHALMHAAIDAADGAHFWEGVRVELTFSFPRPASHYGTGRNIGTLKKSAPTFKVTSPDLDKLCRAVLDALADAGVLQNDARVVTLVANKVYDRPYGVRVVVRRV